MLEKYSRQSVAIDIPELISLVGSMLAPYCHNDIYEGVMQNANGETVFREYGKYEYVLSDGTRSPVDPFDENSMSHANGDIVDTATDLIVLKRQSIPAFKLFSTYNISTYKHVAEFLGSVICIALNRQQEWYRLVCEANNTSAARPFGHEEILKFMVELAEKNAVNFGDASQVYGEMLESLTNTLGNKITDSFPHLNNIIERSASPVLGWDIFNYKVNNNKIIITYLGDARILDFEMRQIKEN